MYQVSKIKKESQRIHKFCKVINIILYIVIIPIILFNFIMIIKSFINPNKIPDFLGYKNFIIVSGSMEPTIMKGDAIFVKEVKQEQIEVNDIISFKEGEIITTHRVIEIIEENGTKKYKTKGDNNNIEDKEKVTFEQIEGKYQFKINKFGTIIGILQNKITLTILIIIIVLNYWYGWHLEHKRQERKEKRKRYEQNKT